MVSCDIALFRSIFAYKLGIHCFEVEYLVCVFRAQNAYFARFQAAAAGGVFAHFLLF